MYYQEKWEDDIFYIKLTPDGKWNKKIPSIDQIEAAVIAKHLTFVQAIAIATNIINKTY